jgi:hypothetical protein
VQTSELDRENAIVLVERWSSGDASAKADASRILKKHGLDESAIEAAAFLRSLRDQLAIEQLQESYVSRRDKALQCIAAMRDMEARLLRHRARSSGDIALLDRPDPREAKGGQ